MALSAPAARNRTLHRASAWLAILALLLPLLALPLQGRLAAASAPSLPFGDASALCLADSDSGLPDGAEGHGAARGAYCPACLRLDGAVAAPPPEGVVVVLLLPMERVAWPTAALPGRPGETSRAFTARGPPPAV